MNLSMTSDRENNYHRSRRWRATISNCEVKSNHLIQRTIHVVAELVEGSPPTSEIRGSIPTNTIMS